MSDVLSVPERATQTLRLRTNRLVTSPVLQDLVAAAVAIWIAWSFASVDVLSNPERQMVAFRIAVLILVLVAGAFLWARREEGATLRSFVADRGFILLSTAIVVGIIFLAFAQTIFAFAPWSEDVGWSEIQRQIANGVRWNPFINKSDYPSSFNVFPMAPLVAAGMLPTLAGKIGAVGYLVVCVYFFVCLGQELVPQLRTRLGTLVLVLLGALSTQAWYIVMTNWHELTHVNPIIFASWYYGVRLINRHERSAAIALAFWCSVALWTLYTPALLAFPIALVVITNLAGSVPIRLKLSLIVWTLMVSAPIIGMQLANRGQGGSFGRHMNFFLKGGEWGNTVFTSERTPLQVYTAISQQLIKDVLPPRGFIDWNIAVRPHVEPLVFALALVGLVAMIVARRRLYLGAVLFPVLFMALGLMASNPIDSPWRESCLTAGVMGLAIVGLGYVWRLFEQNRAMASAVVLVLGVVQLATFAQLSGYLHGIPDSPQFFGTRAAAAAGAFARDWAETSPSKQVLVVDDLPGRLMAVDLAPGTKIAVVHTLADVNPQNCSSSCVLLGMAGPGSRQPSEADLTAALQRLSLNTTTTKVYSKPGFVEAFAIVAKPRT